MKFKTGQLVFIYDEDLVAKIIEYSHHEHYSIKYQNSGITDLVHKSHIRPLEDPNDLFKQTLTPRWLRWRL